MKKRSFLHSIGLIFIYFMLSVFLSGIYAYLNIDNKVVDNIALCVIEIFVALFIAWRLKDQLKGQFSSFLKDGKKNTSIALKYWFIGFLLMVASNFIIIVILKDIAPNESANREILDSYLFYSIVEMCLIGPFVEELLFRLNFKGVFKSRTAFVLATGILFGFMHVASSLDSLSNLLYIIPYSILGCTFSMIYYDTDNITSSILAHSFHNILSVVIILANL